MAKFVLKSATMTVNAVDITDHVSSVTIETSRPEVDVTAMGAVNTEILAGIGSATITASVFQDYAAGEMDATMWPLSQSDTPFVVTVKPTSAAVSATNPLYSMTSLLLTYNPIDGSVGEASTTDLTFANAAQAGITRATS